MTACTDDERREVARRLRSLRKTNPGVTSLGHSYLWSLLWAVCGEGLGESNRDHWFERMCSRLADLIDPGESGQNLDKNRDTVQIESPAVQNAPECDRDALLALAEDVMEAAAMATAVDASKSAEMLAELLLDIARRIREACGHRIVGKGEPTWL